MHPIRTIASVWGTGTALLLFVGCQGEIQPGAEPPAPIGRSPLLPAGPKDRPVERPAAPPVGAPADDLAPIGAPAGTPLTLGKGGSARRLTRSEYRNTVNDLFGVGSGPVDSFVTDSRLGFFTNNENAPGVPIIAENYLEGAEYFAKEGAKTLGKCPPDDSGKLDEEGCVRRLLGSVGTRAFRRPLSADETNLFLDLYRDARSAQGKSHVDGVRLVLTGLLLSPEFLYHVERGDPTRARAGRVPLTGWEIASRLSYMLWRTMPDAALFQAAQSGELETPEGLKRQLTRMLASSRTKDRLGTFFEQWLGYETHRSIFTHQSTYWPVQEYIEDETSLFVKSVVFDGDGKLGTLFTAPYSFVNEAIAKNYKVPNVVGKELRRVELDPTQRAGFLTQIVVLANTSKDNGDVSPVERGRYVRERLLCETMPPPPPEVMLNAPKVDASGLRGRTLQHANDPTCSSCHRLMDPIGLGFNRYDSDGIYYPAKGPGGTGGDESGEVVGIPGDGKFTGVPQLARRLADSDNAQRCASRTWFTYALGREPTGPVDEASLEKMHEAFRASGFDLRVLFTSIVETDAFRTLEPQTNPTTKEDCR